MESCLLEKRTNNRRVGRAGGACGRKRRFACFLCLCLRSFLWLFAELESALDKSAKALAGAAEKREADLAAMSDRRIAMRDGMIAEL